ncbi:MAG: NAD(P)H-dependent oxidoreductase [Chitinophagales bacterium]|nr:NAD(P)H-dependent oxidoreductase [Chitinophagales bacterium]MCZ2393742.1 NAD(P)H-dependent oxidoreductase [Chitinophagales bacterium]
MNHILIIYHSQKGHTEKLVDACYQGILLESNVQVRMKKALDATLEDILWANGVVIATPEYFGNMSGAVKDFFDKTYYPARGQNVNIPYVLIISCDNDGSGAERNVQSIASSYTLRKSLETLNVKTNAFEEGLEQAKVLGQTFAAGLDMGIF